jgi:hypothetical protein
MFLSISGSAVASRDPQKIGKSAITREPPDLDDDVHEKLDFPDETIGEK